MNVFPFTPSTEKDQSALHSKSSKCKLRNNTKSTSDWLYIYRTKLTRSLHLKSNKKSKQIQAETNIIKLFNDLFISVHLEGLHIYSCYQLSLTNITAIPPMHAYM